MGKTTCALAFALARAEAGARVLVVSTDPAHSLSDALGRAGGPEGRLPRRVTTRAGVLEVLEFDPETALSRWLEDKRPALRVAAERGTYLDREDLDRLLDTSIPGIDELIGLLEVTAAARARDAEEVVVDTAPTGHALRLLEMPEMLARLAEIFDGLLDKHRYLFEALGGSYRGDSVAETIAGMRAEAEALRALLVSPEQCTFTWVLIPEPMVIEESRDGLRALEALGIKVDEVIINRWPSDQPTCAPCSARAEKARLVLGSARELFQGRQVRVVSAMTREPRGLAALRRVGVALGRRADLDPCLAPSTSTRPARRTPPRARPVRGERARGRASARAEVLEALVPNGIRWVAVCGKGGVGKTTVAAALGLALAARDPERRILVLSIDPAHSLGDALGVRLDDTARAVPGAPEQVRFRELDAREAHARFRARYLEAIDAMFARLTGGSRFEIAFDRAVLRDLVDLSPPGLDEIVAMLSLLDALVPPKRRSRAPYDLAIVDTAPTGHALRFLALPEQAREWIRVLMRIVLKYRELMGLGDLAEELLELARGVRALSELIKDPSRSRVLAVTRPAALPRLETERLASELERLGVPLGSILVNCRTDGACERCTEARAAEDREIQALAASAIEAPRFEAPRLLEPPQGPRALVAFANTWTRIAS